MCFGRGNFLTSMTEELGTQKPLFQLQLMASAFSWDETMTPRAQTPPLEV